MAQQIEIISLSIDTNALLTKLSETKKSIEQLQASQRELQQAGEGSSTQFIQQAAQLRNLQQSYNRQINVVQQLEAANRNAANATEAVNTALRSEIKSIDQATENNKQLRIVRNQLNLSTEEGRAALEAINKKIDQNTEFIRENVSALEQQKMNIGNYTDSIKEAFGAINPFNGGLSGFVARSREAGGAGNLLKQSFSQLATGIGGVTKAAVGFIATPLGAAIAVVTAAFGAMKAIVDYNLSLQQANKELKAFGVTASELSNVRNEISAVAEAFDKEFKDIAANANSLAKAYGISMSEANRIIAEGLANGGAMNEQYLESIGEYDQLFQKAGYSAQEFVNIINQSNAEGVFSDKTVDAIKEIDIKLKEQATGTRDALVSAFGASFSDEILKQIRTGEKTTAEALDAIAKKSTEVSLTQQQQAALTSNLASSAGEDIGGIMKLFDVVGKAANKTLDETAKNQLELVDANERLNKAQSELFEINGFGDIWTNIKIVAVDALASMLEYISDVKRDIQPLIDFVSVVFSNAWASLKTTIGVVFDFIGGGFKVIGNTVSTFINFFKKVFQGDFSGAIDAIKQGFMSLLNIVSNTFAKIKNTIIDGIKTIVNNIQPVLDFLGVDVDKLNKKLENLKSKNVQVKASTSTTSTTTSTAKEKTIVADKDPNAGANSKAAADAQKKATDEKIKLIDAEIKKQTEALNLFIAQQDIKKKSLADGLSFEEKLMQKRLAILETERKAGKKSQDAYEAEKLNITNSFAKKQAEVAVQLAADELDNKKKSLEHQKLDDSFFSEEKLLKAFDLNNQLAQAERDFQLVRKDQGVINEQEYNAAVDKINEENRIKNEEAQKARDEAKKEQKAIDLENQRLIDEEKFQSDLELELYREDQRYQAELLAAEKTGADTTKIEQKHAIAKKKIEDANLNARLSAYSNMFGQISQLLGENTAASKAASISQSVINTYQGVTEVWRAKSTLPEPMGTIAKVASTATVLASGLGAVKKITATPIPSKAEGGEIPTLRAGVINNGSNILPLTNGDDTLAYVRQGEVILNSDQQRRAGGPRFFRSIGVPGFFNNGGIVGGYSQIENLGQGMKIDYDILASKIGAEVGRANLQLPSPQVAIRDITEAQYSVAKVEAGASL
ncbi:hypothetical protein [Flavobacterium sp.]|uniref:hypothetical protein n=1 Tax=Flavobacterium sp. TaxID=239 RepID=UPI004033E646